MIELIKTLSLLISILFIGCVSEEEPAYKKEGWISSQYKPEVIELSKARLNGNPIILSKKQLLNIYGEPIEVKDTCSLASIISIVSKANEQERVVYGCWIYDTTWNLVYLTLKDSANLCVIDFEKTGMEINTPQINLSKKTRFSEIKEKFPNSYSHRNIGVNLSCSSKGYDWVYLNDDLPKERKVYQNRVELRFKNGKLKILEYYLTPKYTKEQWENYQKLLAEEGATKIKE